MSTDSGEIKLHFLDYWRVIRVRFPLIILVFLLVVITAAVVTYFLPKTYVSTVTMQVKQSDTLEVFQNRNIGGLDPRFLTTQFEIIQRKEILYPVIDALNLQKNWGLPSKEQTYFQLRRMVTMREIRNTELIQILVSSTDNREAMEIANRIADEYQRKRITDSQEWLDRSLTTLRDEVEKQRNKVEELRAEMNRIRVEAGINDLNPDSQEETLQAENTVQMSVEQQVASERLRVQSLRAKHDQISQMTDDQIMRSLVTLEIQDPTIQQVLPQFQEATSEMARLLNSGLGAKHPMVTALRAKMGVMENQLRDQITVLRKTLEANFSIAQESLKPDGAVGGLSSGPATVQV